MACLQCQENFTSKIENSNDGKIQKCIYEIQNCEVYNPQNPT